MSDAAFSMDSLAELAMLIRRWGANSAFSRSASPSVDIPEDEARLLRWLEQGRHGAMHYMQRHGVRRARPQELVPGTLRVISVRMDYLPPEARDPRGSAG